MQIITSSEDVLKNWGLWAGGNPFASLCYPSIEPYRKMYDDLNGAVDKFSPEEPVRQFPPVPTSSAEPAGEPVPPVPPPLGGTGLGTGSVTGWSQDRFPVDNSAGAQP
jgi:hypothetical protein